MKGEAPFASHAYAPPHAYLGGILADGDICNADGDGCGCIHCTATDSTPIVVAAVATQGGLPIDGKRRIIIDSDASTTTIGSVVADG